MASPFFKKAIILIMSSVLFFFVTYLSFAATADILGETDIISEAFLDTSTGLVNSGAVFTGTILTGTLLPEVSTGDILISESVISSGVTLSGITSSGALTGSGGSGNLVVIPPIDYSLYSYYSGTWTQDGTTYGNSFYSNSLGLAKHISGVQIYTYDEYITLQSQSPKSKKQKQGLMTESQSMMTMSAMSIPTNGLVGEYLLDGNANDTSGNGNNGIPNSISWIADRFGLSNHASHFNPSHIYINDSVSLRPDYLTISYWIRGTSMNGSINIEKEGNSINAPWQYASRIFGYIPYFYIKRNPDCGTGVGLESLSSSIAINPQQWTHIVNTFDGTKMRIYINNSQAGEKTITSPGFISHCLGGRLYIRSLWNGDPLSASGDIDNLRIYNRALSVTEIQDLYQEGSAPSVSNDTNIAYINSYFQSNPNLTFFRNSGNDNITTLSNNFQKKQDAESAKNATDEKNLADPVNLATGEFTYDNTLMSIPGVGLPYQLKINYKNQATYNGPLGFNWDHNYNQYLSGETNGNFLYYNGQLGTFRFIKSGSVWLRNEGLRATLVLSGSTYSINYDNGNKASFNSINRLGSLQDINGNTLNFTYSGSYLSGVTDTLGRTMSYSYYTHNRLKTVTDFGGRKADFIYYTGATASGNLYDLANIVLTNSGVTKTIGFEYSTATTDPLSHNITKLIDAKGQIYVENTYTPEDRVLTQKYGSASLGYTYTLSGSQIIENRVLDKLGNRTDYTYDASGNNTAIRYYTPTQSSSVLYTYTYNSLGLMTGEKRPRGNGYKYTYDTNGNLIEKRFKANVDLADSASDLVTSSTYNLRNEKMIESNPNNTQIIYTRDTKGNILTETQSGMINHNGYNTLSIIPIKNYTYFSNGLLQTSTSPEGRITRYNYTSGQLTSITRGAGAETSTGSFIYSPYGTVLSATDGDGFTKNYGYTVFDLVSTGTTAEGIVTGYAYDANNNKIRETRYVTGGIVNSYYYYDSLDHLTGSVVDTKAGQTVTTTYTYDNNGNVTDKKIGNGATVHYTYNEFSKPTEERILLVPGDSSKDIVTSYTYDTNNNLITKIDPRGYTTTYTYDLYDRVIQETNPQGTYIAYLYNKDNTIDTTSTYTSTGLILTKNKTIYNNYGTKLSETNYLDPVASTGALVKKYMYNKDMELVRSWDENNVYTHYWYDSRGNKTMIVPPLNNTIQATYNKRDLKITDGLGQDNGVYTETVYLYDRDGRVKRSTDTLGKYKLYTYDNLGSVVKSTDEMGRVTDIERDYRGLMTKSTSYSGATTSITTYNYDERGNMTSILDPMNHLMSYQYDGINRTTKIIYPDLKEVIMIYDKSSNLVTKTDPNGTVVTNTYDSMNRLTARSISRGSGVGGVTSEIYNYDALGRITSAGDNTNPTGTGSPTYSGSATTNLIFTYDALSRLTSEIQKPIGGTGYTLGYSYTLTSNLSGVTFPDGKIQTITYDTFGRPLVTSYSGQVIATNLYTGSLLSRTTYGNTKITNYTYDTINRPSTMNAGTGIPLPSYTYNHSSDIMSDGTKSYIYDGLARLIRATPTISGATLENYSYDKTGNRVTGTMFTSTGYYSTNTLDQYTAFTGTLSATMSYDNKGNISYYNNRGHTYDYNNRLIQIDTFGSNPVKYVYDVLGRRTQKIDFSLSATNPTTTTYIYSGDNIISEYRTIGVLVGGTGSLMPLTLKKNYINGIGTDSLIAYDAEEQVSPTSTGKTTKRYYYHLNQLGSVIALTSSTGSVLIRYSYDSFGLPKVMSGSTLVDFRNYTGNKYSNVRLFTGREHDKEAGYYYMRARYYNAENFGRFLSRDPVGQNDQINLYTYVANSPLKYVDRMGREKILIFTGTPQSDSDRNLIETTYAYQRKILLERGIKESNIIRIPGAMTPKAVNTGAEKYLGDIKQAIFIMHGVGGTHVGLINQQNVGELNSLKLDNSDNPSTFLISCWAGLGGNNSIAQKMSNALNSNVTAVDNGTVWVNEGVENDIPGHPIGEPFPEIGKWQTFTPST